MFENGGGKNCDAFTEQAKIACAGFVIWFRIMDLLGGANTSILCLWASKALFVFYLGAVPILNTIKLNLVTAIA